MRFGSFILKNVFRRKTRSALTILGVTMAIAAVVALLGVSGGFERSLEEVYKSGGVDLVVVRAGVTQRQTSSLRESIGQRIAALDGVGAVTPVLTELVKFREEDALGSPLIGVPPDSAPLQALRLLRGEGLTNDSDHKIMLGETLANQLNKTVGDEVLVRDQTFECVGVFAGQTLVDQSTAYLRLVDMQALLNRANRVNEFRVTLKDDVEDKEFTVQRLISEIESMTGALELEVDEGETTAAVDAAPSESLENHRLGLTATATGEYVRSNTEIRLGHAMAWITSAIALLIGAVGVLNTMIMSVLERTQEIGILRAIGWRRARIIRMILCESLSLTTIGSLVGSFAAVVLVRVLSQFPMAKGYVRGEISPTVIAIGILLSLVVGLVGGLYPAFRGASLPPTEALRYE